MHSISTRMRAALVQSTYRHRAIMLRMHGDDWYKHRASSVLGRWLDQMIVVTIEKRREAESPNREVADCLRFGGCSAATVIAPVSKSRLKNAL